MKTKIFRSMLFIAAFFIATSTDLQAAPSLPVTKPPVGVPMNSTGPNPDPMAMNGQWFKDLATGEEECRTHEFYDNMSGFGGGNKQNLAIEGYVVAVTTNAAGEITAFDINATIWNDTASSVGSWPDGSNSHGESLSTQSNYVGTLADTKLTAEFAIADPSLLPNAFGYPATPYRDAFPYITAENEDQRAWYCWNELDPPNGQEHGNYYVPTWDFGDIYINQSATRTLNFSVNPAMPLGDPRHSVIMGSYNSGHEVLANRTTSLKISTWIDDIGRDFPGPEGMLRNSDVSVFHDEEEPYEPTHKMHYPQLPDPTGWDVRACYGPDGLQKVLADDFRCTQNGPITNITFWGSWYYDEFEEMDPCQGITNIHLSIHNDTPAGVDQEYSHPSNLLWDVDFDPHKFPTNGWAIEIIPEIPSAQGWYDPNLPPGENYILNNHSNYFRYVVSIPTNEAFVQVSNTIYWLDISVETIFGQWGWKSTTNHWNDDAVYTDMPVQDPLQWKELYEPPDYEQSLDLAFVIDGPEEEEPEPDRDWGDAPDSVQTPQYPTLAVNNGANHMIIPGAPYFDDSTQTDQPDAESDGQPTANADGDDLNGARPDDEDGITIPTLYAGQSGSVTITVDDGAGGTGTGGGYVDAWIDFNGDGTWATPGEQIVSGWLPQGANTVAFIVPPGSALGQTFGRFRINSAAAGLAPTGIWPTGGVPDGEVEDHPVTIAEAEENLDWGDAPDSLSAPPGYNTLAVNSGANHTIVPGVFMGALIDPELDGQPNATATGDDFDAGGNDDDGVATPFPLLIPGQIATFTVTVSFPGWLDVWLDVDGDGTWTLPRDYVYSGPVFPGGSPVPVTPPYNAVPGTSFMRFRYNTGAALPPTGWAADGEVEDYMVTIEEPQLDWGDAPDVNYNTLAASVGPSHIIATGVQLGSTIDAEADGQPSAGASGDGADEDGITFVGKVVSGSNATINVVVGSAGGNLDGWIDYNRNNVFDDPSEHIFGGSSTALSSSPTNLSFTVPSQPTLQLGQSYARFRLSTAGGLPPDNNGLASTPDGEVEDYTVDLYQPAPTNLVITNIVVTLSNDLSKTEWIAEPNITYQAQSTTNLVISNSWTDVGGWVMQNWQTNSAAPTCQFYRVTAPWTE